jgi:hypothetical protein
MTSEIKLIMWKCYQAVWIGHVRRLFLDGFKSKFVTDEEYSYNKNERDALFLKFIFDTDTCRFLYQKVNFRNSASRWFLLRMYHDARSFEFQVKKSSLV